MRGENSIIYHQSGIFSKQLLYLIKICMDMLNDFDYGHDLYIEKKGVKPYSDAILKGSGAILSYF